MTKKLTLLAATIAVATTSQAQYYQVGGFAYSSTNSGIVAGTDAGADYIWNATTQATTVIGGSLDAGVTTISGDGRYVGGTAVVAGNTASQMARYDTMTGTWTGLGTLGSASGSNASAGWAMNGAGNVSAGNAWITAGYAHAMLNKNGVVIDLGATVAGHSSRGNAINFGDGSVVAGWDEDANGFWQGAFWKNGVETLMADGATQLQDAQAVTADGRYVYGNGPQVYKWDTTLNTVSYLANPFGSDMSVTGVSADGSVAVGYYGSLFFGPPRKGWIYTTAGGVQLLNNYAVGTSGYTNADLFTPLGVSQDGTYITGGYANAAGFFGGGFVLHSQAVPEPMPMLLLGIGAVALFAKKRLA